MTSNSIQQVDIVLALLEKPLDQDALDSGWTEESQDAAVQYFRETRAALERGQPLAHFGIVRGLDHRGVVGGSLLENVARVANLLRKQN